ncbi:MAG TPA: methyltransferase domain-containing protein [Rhizomicrobium sp.]|nr:methyltransferase domain-containing protein [Rhizomicrobium sp.]
MYVNRKVLELGKEPDALLAFFHAQRTGGSTFLRWLGESVPKSEIFSRPTTGDGFAHWKKIDMARLEGYRVFGGFSQFFEKDDLVRPFVGFSLVRHPFHRICSIYEMSRRDPLHYRHEQAIRTTFEQFYQQVDEEEPSYFRNLMCNRICNAPSADEALETMERRFGAVSTTTRLCDMTALIATAYGWRAKPVKPIGPDEERYRAYDGSPVYADIVEKSAEDLRLYEYVRDFAEPAPAKAQKADEPAPIVVNTAAPTCPVCGSAVAAIGEKGECPACHSPARTRSLPAVLKSVVAPQLAKTNLAELPLLAFAATGWERRLLGPHFKKLLGASLYGRYSPDNMTGVDVRDLSRFEAASFSGAFGILLFDYFPEHEKALAELARVIAPGGILFTLILPARVQPDKSPPAVTRRITPRPGYFDYIPEGETLLNVNVGQDWLLAAIDRAGFTPLQLRVADGFTDEVSQWFTGIRREGPAPTFVDKETPAAEPEPEPAPPAAAKPRAKPSTPPARPAVMPAPAAPALAKQTRMTEGFAQEFTTALEGFDGLKSVTVKLTIPQVPVAARRVDFAEHRWRNSLNRSTREVNCVGPGMIMTSEDLGGHWEIVEPAELAGKPLMNHFTTDAGTRLIQNIGWSENPDLAPEDAGAIYRLDAIGKMTGRTQNSGARWHGPRAIGEQDGVILYSDYFDNAKISAMTPGTEEWERRLRTCHVWRSDDDGKSWRSIFEKAPTEIRHFHFVLPDPYAPRTWWLSAGDKPQECRCWRSDDNGGSWREVTNPHADIVLHPLAERSRQAVFRATDMAILPDKLIWGTDDLMIFNDEFKILVADPEKQAGFPAPGSRIVVAPKSDRLEPRDLAVAGHPLRNFVDVGPGWIAFTEAKYAPIGFEPVVYFVAKDAPHRVQELFRIPQTRTTKGSGFSYSRASRAAVDGRFFSFRASGDLAAVYPRLLQWDVAFA